MPTKQSHTDPEAQENNTYIGLPCIRQKVAFFRELRLGPQPLASGERVWLVRAKGAQGRALTVGPTEPLERGWSDEECRTVLASYDLKATMPRMVLLRELSQRRTPASHAEIFEVLEPQGFDRVTLYRNLQTLSEAGLVLRIEAGDRTWRFELLRQHGELQHPEHAHFVCMECGSVACLPEDAVTLNLADLRAKAIEVQIKGRCQQCVAAAAVS